MTFLVDKNEQLVLPSLRIIGNLISKENNIYTQILLEKGILDKLFYTASSLDPIIRKETQWTLCNIAAGSKYQVNQLVKHNIVQSSANCLIDPDLKTRIEASYVFYNIAKNSVYASIHHLVEKGVLSYIKEAIKQNDSEIIVNLLEFCLSILLLNKNVIFNNHFRFCDSHEIFVNSGCLDIIENLIMHNNQKIYQLSSDIIQSVCGYDEAQFYENI